ncbi:MAG: hypothetical protein IPH88_18480 [Bacteroidales bacterium]|nr:hypothetical protein [Bacteroidales bacterium]
MIWRFLPEEWNRFHQFYLLSYPFRKNTPIHHLAPQSGTIDKASLCFALPHETGSLSTVLSILASHGMNLTKIQSMPIVGKAWQYFFHDRSKLGN